MEKSGCSCGGGCITEVFLMARFCKFEEKCFLNCITLKLILIDVINKHSGRLNKILKNIEDQNSYSNYFYKFWREKNWIKGKKLVEKIDGNAGLTFRQL